MDTVSYSQNLCEFSVTIKISNFLLIFRFTTTVYPVLAILEKMRTYNIVGHVNIHSIAQNP